MTSFYDERDLEEELTQINCPDDDLQFEYLFEYEPHCSDFAGGDQGWSRWVSGFLFRQPEWTPVSLSLSLSSGFLSWLKVNNWSLSFTGVI